MGVDERRVDAGSGMVVDWDEPIIGARLDHFTNELRGCGPFIHPDRPDEVLHGDVTFHTGAHRDSSLLLPVVPAAGGSA